MIILLTLDFGPEKILVFLRFDKFGGGNWLFKDIYGILYSECKSRSLFTPDSDNLNIRFVMFIMSLAEK